LEVTGIFSARIFLKETKDDDKGTNF